MSNMQANSKRRRNFLLALGSGSVAAIVGAVTGRAGTAASRESAAADDAPPATGYKLSEHVRAYYRTTRI